jgi:hypothetical protein
MHMPRPLTARVNQVQIEQPFFQDDVALVEMEDHREFVCHDSGVHGAFSSRDRLGMVRKTLVDVESTNKNWPIMVNMGCIYSFTYPDRVENKDKSQIGVGIIRDVKGKPDDPDVLIDIQFCPPKGAKPAGPGRPDTLYQNISAETAFNLNYKSKKGKKVENEDKNLPRSVLLAFNLELNKSNGKFSERRNCSDSRYNCSSIELAHTVITQYYEHCKQK